MKILNIHVSFVLLILIIKMNELQFVQYQTQKNVQNTDMMIGSNDSLQTAGMAFTTGGSADPSLYENKGKLH